MKNRRLFGFEARAADKRRFSLRDNGLTGPTATKLRALLSRLMPDRKIKKITRVFPGHCQRSEGAWSWLADMDVGEAGSQWPMAEVLKWGMRAELNTSTAFQTWIFPPADTLQGPGDHHA